METEERITASLAPERRRAVVRNRLFNFNPSKYMVIGMMDFICTSFGVFHFKEETVIVSILPFLNSVQGLRFTFHLFLHGAHVFSGH